MARDTFNHRRRARYGAIVANHVGPLAAMILKQGTPEEWHDIQLAVEDGISDVYAGIMGTIAESIDSRLKGKLNLCDADLSTVRGCTEDMLDIDSQHMFEQLKEQLSRKEEYTYHWDDEHGVYTMLTDNEGVKWVIVKDSAAACYVDDVTAKGDEYGYLSAYVKPGSGTLTLAVPKHWVDKPLLKSWLRNGYHISTLGNVSKMQRKDDDEGEEQGDDGSSEENIPGADDKGTEG